MDHIKQQIKYVMATVLNVEVADIPENCSYGTFERWDSLGHMNLVVALEEEFEIRFDDEEVSDMLNLFLIYNFVISKLETN
ncbi:MAG: acyl carrier protein [Bacteroidia bacterium]|nr:acyl carrier protein [Bacteroidia bacterium]